MRRVSCHSALWSSSHSSSTALPPDLCASCFPCYNASPGLSVPHALTCISAASAQVSGSFVRIKTPQEQARVSAWLTAVSQLGTQGALCRCVWGPKPCSFIVSLFPADSSDLCQQERQAEGTETEGNGNLSASLELSGCVIEDLSRKPKACSKTSNGKEFSEGSIHRGEGRVVGGCCCHTDN